MDQGRADRDIAATDSLGDRDQVRDDARMVDAEIATGPPDSGDDFVDDQQDIVAIADLTDPPEVAVRGRQGAERPAGDRLDDECRDVLRADQADGLLELVGTIDMASRLNLAERTAIAIRRVDVRKVEQIGLERFAPPRLAGERQGAERAAVIAVP